MELHYKQFGEGKAFVILHGLFGSSDNWQTHGKKIAEYFDVYLVDQRNHGESGWSDDFNYDIMADDLYNFLNEHQLDEIVLMGHSMGGKTALRFAQKHPEMIDKLIIVDMGVKEYPITHDTIIEGLKSIDLSVIDSRSGAAKQLEKYIDNKSIRQFLLKNLYWKEKGQLAWSINLKVLEEKLPEVVKALPKKETMLDTLFISGGQSDYVLAEDQDSIRELFPLADFHTIERAGHWIHAEAPEEFIEEVLGFALR
ncbi:alpha/beta fold hydrolase [Brumimicrobium aurantiacum]|uniref:Alpha/beta fold hydrolase n=1 Tax=Brumimicrobium aurantiacum TaxID=1737063 RepID=A0A3E1EVE3_9FLAO|nr:alpha/beta fold hydrolase [Brumimicrobium aurantiacum]RFC53488.1 alpha/beta fold hydrolase [Brumimicrobium aurantiacum]